MRKTRRTHNRRGYTLVELVLAIAITSMVAACVSTLIGYSIQVRSMSATQTQLYTVSLRVHTALTNELRVASDVTLYHMDTPPAFTALTEGEAVVFLRDGRLYYAARQEFFALASPLLPISDGFDAYNGAYVESMWIELVSIYDYLNADTPDMSKLYRCARVTTTISLSGRQYTHSSTIRFDEMLLNSKQINISTSTSNFALSAIRAPLTTDVKKDYYNLVRYTRK